MTDRTAFVIDDEIFIALDVEANMMELGYEVIGPAFTLEEGFEVVESHGAAPTIAVMDINIGGELVWPLAKRLKSMGTKIIFISANRQHLELNTIFEYCPVVDKPASHESIANAVKTVFQTESES